MASLSFKSLVALTVSSFIFSPTAYLSAKQKNQGVGFEVVDSEELTELTSPTNLPPIYPMPSLPEGKLRLDTSSRSGSTFKGRSGSLPEGAPGLVGLSSLSNIEPSRYGTYKFPHTTQLVRGYRSAKKNTAKDSITTTSPYNRAGKLYIQQTSSSGMGRCSASMIGRGLVLTAAHCLFTYGEAPKYKKGTSVKPYRTYFVPAANKTTNTSSLNAVGTTGPYGAWQVDGYVFPVCYVKGNCTGGWTSNDIALIRLKKRKSKPLPWNHGIGYFGYGWNNYGFVKNSLFSSIKSNQITQLGYPAAIGDSTSNYGGAMVRTDSLAREFTSGSSNYNLWGSMQSPGASGGPALVNFGMNPKVKYQATKGSKGAPNILVGTLSFGYATSGGSFSYHALGASVFGKTPNFRKNAYRDSTGQNWGAGNIGALMDFACSKDHANWKAGGYCRSSS